MPQWLIVQAAMILLTKINGAPIAVNSDLIQYIEETPDTVITMTTSDKVVVKQKMTEIIDSVVRYRRLVAGLVQEGDFRVHNQGSGPQRI